MQQTQRLLYALCLSLFATFTVACNDDDNDHEQTDTCEETDTCEDENCEDDDSCEEENPDLWDEDGECGNGIVEGWEECDDGDDMPNSTCHHCLLQHEPTGEALTLPSINAWKYIEPEGAICRDGSQAGYAVSPGNDTSKVLFYFEGGGACFEAMNCAANPPNIPPEAQIPDHLGGIFDRDNANNPFQDWTIVFLPYCTGDVFVGNTEGADIEKGPENQMFVGDRNMKLFLDQIIPTFQEVEHVVSSGISAGGLASVVNAKRLSRAFPDARVTVLDDGGPPLSTEVVSGCMQRHWMDLYNLQDTVLPECGWACEKANDLLLPITQDLVASNDRIDMGLFSFIHDGTVRLLFTFGMNDCQMLPIPYMKEKVLEDGLQKFREVMRQTGEDSEDQTALRTATYYAPGKNHVCINGPCFYDTVVDGVPLYEWTQELLDRNFTDVGFTD